MCYDSISNGMHMVYYPKGDFAMKKILVVEDDLILNKTLCYNLRNSGYQVNSANTAGAAVKEAGAAHFDLVVLDVNLPDGSGFDLCRRIKAAKSCACCYLSDSPGHGRGHAERL